MITEGDIAALFGWGAGIVIFFAVIALSFRVCKAQKNYLRLAIAYGALALVMVPIEALGDSDGGAMNYSRTSWTLAALAIAFIVDVLAIRGRFFTRPR